MRVERAPSYPVSIFMAGDVAAATCRQYCDEVGLCVTLSPAIEYIYTAGWESGFVVGLINYPRFPCAWSAILDHAHELGNRLRIACGQESYTIQTPEETIWKSWRQEDCDSDAAAVAAPCGDMAVSKDQQARADKHLPKGVA